MSGPQMPLWSDVTKFGCNLWATAWNKSSLWWSQGELRLNPFCRGGGGQGALVPTGLLFIPESMVPSLVVAFFL